MKYTKIPETAFKNIQLNAGILTKSFNPATGVVTGIIGATSGGVNFKATPTFSDYGSDIDNCPTNVLELKKLDNWDAKMTGNFVSVTKDLAKFLIGACDVDADDATHLVPRKDITADDYSDLWWVGDYSDENGETNAGYCAIHLINSLSTGGFQLQSTNKGKGTFAFEFTGHYSMEEQDKVPFEIYIKQGTSAE